MSMSRVRSRVAAIAGALPVLLAASPVGVALASGEYTVENVVANAQIIGPNVGFLGHGIGQSGTTPIFKVTAPSDGSTITNVRLTLTNDNTAFNISRDLADGDGLALYADDNNNGDFDAADKAKGAKSASFSVERPDGTGNVPIRLNFPVAATGRTTYWITVHPNTSALNGQQVRFEMASGALEGNAGNGPNTLISTPTGDNRMVIDSQRPNTAPRTAFTAEKNKPGTQDAYLVAPSAGASEADLDIVFFNSPTDTAPSNILTRIGYNPALAPEAQPGLIAVDPVINPSSPSQPHRITIGDGTGIVPGATTVARNNQLGNNVYARLLDKAGNLQDPATALTDCFVTTETACPSAPTATNPFNGNPVVAPLPPTTAQLNPSAPAINLSNQAAVPTQSISSADAGSARTPTGATSADKSTRATKSVVRIVPSGTDGQPILDDPAKSTDESSVAWLATANHTLNTQNKVPEGAAFVVAYNTDDFGNDSTLKLSAPIKKDITRPTLSVELGSGSPQGVGGDVVMLQFSEPMTTANITPTAAAPAGTGCQAEASNSSNTVSEVLPVFQTTEGDRSWGYNNCFAWSPGGASATVTLGDSSTPGCIPNGAAPLGCIPLPSVGNKVLIKTTLTDANGNQALGVSPGTGNFGFATIVAPPPRPDLGTPAQTRDLNADGKLDAVQVTFTSAVNLGTFAAAKDNFSIVSGGISVPVATAEYPTVDHKTVLFAFGSNFGTGVVPEVRLASPGPGEPTGFVGEDDRPVPAFSTPTIDKAAPLLKSAHTGDNDHNGKIDRVVVTFTEPIDHAKDHNNEVVGTTPVPGQPGGYRVVGYENIGGTNNTVTPAPTANRNTVTPVDGAPTDTKIITLTESANFDTAAKPILQYFGGAPFPVDDPNTDEDQRAWWDVAGNKGPFSTSNTVPTVQVTVADATYPHLVQRKTGDLDGDGRLDTMDLKFSEVIPTVTTGASFTVTGHAIQDQFGLGNDGIRLVIDETAPRGLGDTGAKPTVKYNSGMFDGEGNVTSADVNPVASVDGAPPAIVGACVSSPKGSNGLCPEDDPANDATTDTDKGNKLNIFFSELIANASSLVTDYKVEQPQGTDKMTPAPNHAVADSGTGETGFSIVTLTWTAAKTLDVNADAVVRLTGNNVIDDRAAPANKSIQVSDVTAFKLPSVDLAVSCPVAASAGFCSQLAVNVNTNSSSGVTMWRLKETVRANPVVDADFTATMPTTYTFASEGTYTLYLSGKDAYGRLTPEDSAEIRIIKTPTLKNVQFVNSTPGVSGGWSNGGTITDGDNMHIAADAYGADAGEWATQTVGGGCLPQHMSIDVRSITGRSNLGRVAPLKCDLRPSGEGPFRHMEFPVFKASNTTRYPVGTVLKTSDRDPGSMIVDGPGGTHRRRAFISVAARRSWLISDASVIKVPSTLVNGIPRLTPSIGYRDGALLRSSTGYYLVYRNQKRPVSTAQLSAWRITTRMAYNATTAELRAMSTGSRLTGSRHPAGVWIRYSNGAIYQIVRNSRGVNVRRKLADRAALRTLVHYGHVVPAVSADNQMRVESWLIGYRDGTVLKHSNGTFSVVARGSLRRFANAATFNSMGFNGANALGANGRAMPRVNGQSYRTGVPIDRYKITTAVIKVTNKAGAIATATITPAQGGLFALGTFDPAPSGWDFTR